MIDDDDATPEVAATAPARPTLRFPLLVCIVEVEEYRHHRAALETSIRSEIEQRTTVAQPAASPRLTIQPSKSVRPWLQAQDHAEVDQTFEECNENAFAMLRRRGTVSPRQLRMELDAGFDQARVILIKCLNVGEHLLCIGNMACCGAGVDMTLVSKQNKLRE